MLAIRFIAGFRRISTAAGRNTQTATAGSGKNYTIQTATAGSGKNYTTQTATAGSGKNYTIQTATAGSGKRYTDGHTCGVG